MTGRSRAPSPSLPPPSRTCRCRACGGAAFSVYLDFGDQPISTHLVAPGVGVERYSKRYLHCRECGHVQVETPVPAALLYDAYARVSPVASPPAAPALARRIVASLSHPRDLVVEIGCGGGDFLAALRQAGARNLVGIDAARNCVRRARDGGFEVVHGPFDDALAKAVGRDFGAASVVVMRHVLEHIDDAAGFLAGARRLLEHQGRLVVEIPDLGWAIARGDFTSFTDEHVSYFSAHSLARLLARCEFGVESLETVPHTWSDALLAWCGPNADAGIAAAKPIPAATKAAFRGAMEDTAEALASLAREPLAFYGAFCRTVNLLNYLDIFLPKGCFAVDDDAGKWGLRLPSSDLAVEPPAVLGQRKVPACVIGAVNYEGRIVAANRGYVDGGGRFYALFPLAPLPGGTGTRFASAAR